jgi:hypothetical protein
LEVGTAGRRYRQNDYLRAGGFFGFGQRLNERQK